MENPNTKGNKRGTSDGPESQRERCDSFAKTLQGNRIRFFHDSSPAVPDELKFNQTAPNFGIKRNLLKFFEAVKTNPSSAPSKARENSRSSQNLKKDNQTANNYSKLPPKLKPNHSTPVLQGFDDPETTQNQKRPLPTSKPNKVNFNSLMESNAQATQAYLMMKQKLSQYQKAIQKPEQNTQAEREQRRVEPTGLDGRGKNSVNGSFNNGTLNSSFSNQNTSFNGPINVSFSREKAYASMKNGLVNPSLSREPPLNSSNSHMELNKSIDKENIPMNQGYVLLNHVKAAQKPKTRIKDPNNRSRENIPTHEISRDIFRTQNVSRGDSFCNVSRDNLNRSREKQNMDMSRENINVSRGNLNRSRDNSRGNSFSMENIQRSGRNNQQRKGTSRHAQNSGNSVNLPTPLALIRNDSIERSNREPSPAPLPQSKARTRKQEPLHQAVPMNYYQVNIPKTRGVSNENSFSGGRQPSSSTIDQAQILKYIQNYHSKANILREITTKEYTGGSVGGIQGAKINSNGLFHLAGGVTATYNGSMGHQKHVHPGNLSFNH